MSTAHQLDFFLCYIMLEEIPEESQALSVGQEIT